MGMNFNQAISYLDSLHNNHVKFELSRIEAAVKAAAMPHLAYKTVHVTGTNGKGSTASFIASILNEARP